MSWLARLDARAQKWPRPIRWSYLGLRWYLIAAGFIGVTGLAIVEFREGRVGLGTGFFTVLVLATIKGVLMAINGSPQPPQEPPPRAV